MRGIFEVMRQYHMVEAGERVIVGISGGADSVCLLHVLLEYRRQIPFELYAVHVEHGLRGQESLEDARFVQRLCERLEVECRVVHAQVRQLAKEEGLSLEEAGRRERYRIFEETREALGAQRIAVAHSRDDQAETVLWNLARGSGLKGLCGIAPVRGRIIRPLLFTGRAGIERILQDAGLSWRTDHTNLQEDYTRNRIRLSVLPVLEQLNAQAAEHIAQAAGRLRQVQQYLDRETDRAQERCLEQTDDFIRIALPEFAREDPLIRTELLHRAAGPGGGMQDIGSVHLEALWRLAEADCGKELDLPGGRKAVREKEALCIFAACPAGEGPEPAQERRVKIPGSVPAGGWTIRTELLENRPELWDQIITEKKYTKWLSYDTINNNLLFRTRRPGDYLVVNRQGGRKKLNDYLTDKKVPRRERDRIWLLADGSHVLWVVGYRISEAARVDHDTRNVLRIQLEEE